MKKGVVNSVSYTDGRWSQQKANDWYKPTPLILLP
jgi:hypothetical protein